MEFQTIWLLHKTSKCHKVLHNLNFIELFSSQSNCIKISLHYTLSLFAQDTKVSDSAQPELHCMSFQTWYQMSQHSFITQNTSFQTIQFDKTSKCHPHWNTLVSQQNLASVLLYLGPCIYVHVRAMQNIICAPYPNKTQPRKVSVCCTPDSGPLHLAQKFWRNLCFPQKIRRHNLSARGWQHRLRESSLWSF